MRRRRNMSEGRLLFASVAGLSVMGLAGWAAVRYKMPALALAGLVAGAAAMGVSAEASARA